VSPGKRMQVLIKVLRKDIHCCRINITLLNLKTQNFGHVLIWNQLNERFKISFLLPLDLLSVHISLYEL